MTRKTAPHCITLIGMMGSGKTLVGRALARRLGWSFIDLDERISQEQGRSIPEIFAAEGEAAFRALELRTLSSILSPLSPAAPRPIPLPPKTRTSVVETSAAAPGPIEETSLCSTVLSLGGGTILQPECAALVCAHSLCIRLTASVETLCERLRADRNRPLLQGGQPLEDRIAQLLSERESAYAAAAHITIPTDAHTPDDIIAQLLSLLR
ncbi:MAG: shikimate kinase [Bacteroidia bacterium]|nr:shikimate kinase [Bacteroidia bacterium]